MMRRARLAGAIALLAIASVALAPPVPAAASQWPNVNWTALLSALPTPTSPQPGPAPYCQRGRVSCLRTEISRMTTLRDSLGCDHRAVFATTYLELTKTLLQTGDPRRARA